MITVLVIGVMGVTSQCNYSQKSNEKKGSGVVMLNMQWNEGIDTQSIPNTLRYCLYPSGNGAMIQMEGSPYNFKITLPPDTYKLLVFNADDKNVRFKRMNSYEDAEVMLMQHAEGMHKPAPSLYGAIMEELVVLSEQTSKIDLLMKPLVQQVNISVQVKNEDNIQHCEAVLTGVVSALNLSTNRSLREATEMLFRMEKDKKSFKKSLFLLDAIPHSSESDTIPNLLTIHFTLKDGSKVSSTVDLGFPFKEYEHQDITIELNAETEKQLVPSFVFSDYVIRPICIMPLSSML